MAGVPSPTGPLAGLKVIEMAGIGPVPLAGLMLSEMGARVLRIERVAGGPPLIDIPAEYDLDRHGRDGEPPIPFTHCDIGGSYCENMDWQHGRPTGRPVVGLLTGLLGGDA